MKFASIAFVAAFTFAPIALIAQPQAATSAPVATTAPSHTINQRKENQQDRVAQGVNSGQLTSRETSRLEHQEAGINQEESNMRAHDNGNLTKQDRKTLRHQQKKVSRRIHRDKHNARVQQ